MVIFQPSHTIFYLRPPEPEDLPEEEFTLPKEPEALPVFPPRPPEPEAL